MYLDGLRLSKTVNGAVTQHIWDGTHMVLELNGSGGVSGQYIRGLGGRLMRNGVNHWFVYNARGDVVQRTNNSGLVQHTYRYSAFGVELNPNAANTNPWRFAGEYYDRETGRYYLRARFFDPRIGRFTQPDPHWGIHNMIWGDDPRIMNQRTDRWGRELYTRVPDSWAIAQSGNLFVYCINNPVMFVDSSGRFIKLADKFINWLINTPPAQQAIKYVDQAATWVGSQVVKGAQWVGNQVQQGVQWVGSKFQKAPTRVDDLSRGIRDWLGNGTRVIKNKSGDTVFVSQDGLRKVRFDINNPAPHNSPHVHFERFVNGKWKPVNPNMSQIYPFNVPPN